ncbi:hypothetical protein P7C71_g1006, partial [Lecanoromycetidae sp. Uapishka_2]
MKLEYSIEQPLNREPNPRDLVDRWASMSMPQALPKANEMSPLSFITHQDGYDRNHGPIPHINGNTHTVKVNGQVRKSLDLSIHDLKTRFTQHEIVSALQCAGNRRHTMRTLLKEVNGIDWFDGAVLNAKWRGPKLRDVLTYAGVSVKNPKEAHVAFACYQTEIQSESYYGGSIELERAMRDNADVLVALEEPDLPLLNGLDPTQNQNGNAEETIYHGEDGGSSDDGSIDKMPSPSKRKRFSGFTSRTKAKTKKILKLKGADGEVSETEEDGVLEQLEHNPAFATSKLEKKKRLRPGKKAERALGNVQALGKTIIHPIDGIKRGATRTTAGQLSKVDRPYLSRKADLDLLEAHDNLKQAESTCSSQQGTTDDEQGELAGVLDSHRDRIKEMEAHRESLKAAWTTSRHVRRVRVVPKRHMKFPDNEHFEERDDHGQVLRFDWFKWLGLNLIYYTQDFSAQYIDDFDELPFDIDSTRHYVERLVISSGPWQSWAMNVRAIYRWDKPLVTTKWFALYIFGWYTDHMAGFFYCYIIYIVVKNRYAPESIESLRESVQKNVDSRSTASKFGELIDKHGRSDWLGPVMEDIGPFIQLQLGDMANMLEVFSK